jgi:hypothetical protein
MASFLRDQVVVALGQHAQDHGVVLDGDDAQPPVPEPDGRPDRSKANLAAAEHSRDHPPGPGRVGMGVLGATGRTEVATPTTSRTGNSGRD